jgi:predicted dinucleotide-binding enzyme
VIRHERDSAERFRSEGRRLASSGMRIGIIGAGRLGSALGKRFLDGGHEVVFGDRARSGAPRVSGAGAGTNAQAAAFGDVVVLAVPFAAIETALAEAGDLRGKVLWSCVNAVKPDLSGLAVGFDTSAAEEVARRAGGARVVAAIPPFAEALMSGNLGYDAGLEPTVFLCGGDGHAKGVVQRLVMTLGVQPVDAGPLAAARLVEPAMMLLVNLAYAGAPRDLGLRLLERTV